MKLTKEQQKVVEENHNLIYWYINKYNLSLSEYYDLLAIALCNAVMKFDSDKGVKFSSYFKKVADSYIFEEHRKSKAIKRTHEEVPLMDYNSGVDDMDIVDKIFIKDVMEGKHGEIVRLKAEGHSQYHIQDMLGVSRRQVSNALRKVRTKYYEVD